MYNIARITDEEREILFRNTADKKNMSEGIIEKDFWVTITLDYLFHRSRWKDKLAFKGGTSLSKAYNLIERFSEDIDLILDWRVLGYEKDEPWKDRSNTKQDIFFEGANERAADFLSKEFVPIFKADMEKILEREIKVYIDPENSQIVNFEYPCLFTEPYILRMIRLEIGALAAWTPVETKRIRSYASEVYESAFSQPATDILTTSAERSFWEKVTILHREAYRAGDKQMPARYSRHYYDLYCFGKSQYKESAFRQLDLLERVVAFKKKFYRCPWAKYEEAKPGTMRLVPAECHRAELKLDYESMKNMIYGVYPSFEELMNYIRELEEEINQLGCKGNYEV